MIVIRNFRPDDIASYVRLIAETDEVDRRDKATSVEHVKERLGQPGYQPEQDSFFAEMDGLLVGYVDVVRELEIGRVILDGAVHPAHRGRGIGSRLLEVAVEHSRKLGATVAHIPVAHKMAASRRFVENRGFAVVRRHWRMTLMQYRGGTLHIPPGFALRHFVPGDEERLCALQNLAFTGSWGFRPNTVEDIRYLVNTGRCHPEGILFITQGQRIVAYCWTMDHPIDKEKASIHMMGVDPGYRGRGLGRAILVAAIEHLVKRGVKEVELSVDSRNPAAKRLYRSVGFARKGTILWYQKRLSPVISS